MTGTARSAIEVTEPASRGWRRSAPRSAAAGDAVSDAERVANSLRSRPTLKCGPRAARTRTRTSSRARDLRGGDGQVAPERAAQGVARLGTVEPERGDVVRRRRA